MLRKIGYLTEEQFELAIIRSRLSDKGKAAAKRVLVGKETQAQVAKEIEVSREKVRQYCHAVYKQFADLSGCPKGWVGTSICLPRMLVARLCELEKDLRMKASGEMKPFSEEELLSLARKVFG